MENKSGIYPSGDRILVKPTPIESKTAGGIEIPYTVVETHMMGQTDGVLVAAGPDSWNDYSKPFAKVGDKIAFAKYGGQRMWGKDGVEYRMLNDEDITCTLDEGVSFNEWQARERLSKKD